MSQSIWEDAEVFVISRASALEDELQFPLSVFGDDAVKVASSFYKIPIFLSSGVKAAIDGATTESGSVSPVGVLHDMFFVARHRNRPLNQSKLQFEFKPGHGRPITVYAEVGPMDYDDPAPALTFFLPIED